MHEVIKEIQGELPTTNCLPHAHGFIRSENSERKNVDKCLFHSNKKQEGKSHLCGHGVLGCLVYDGKMPRTRICNPNEKIW